MKEGVAKRKLRVYGWQSFRNECRTNHRQTREICAASSMAEVARIVGENSPKKLFNLGETGNAHEMRTALAKPRTVFWQPYHSRNGEPFTESGIPVTQPPEN